MGLGPPCPDSQNPGTLCCPLCPQPSRRVQSAASPHPKPWCREPPSRADSLDDLSQDENEPTHWPEQDGPPHGGGGRGSSAPGSSQASQGGQELSSSDWRPVVLGCLLPPAIRSDEMSALSRPVRKHRQTPSVGRRCGMACLEGTGQDRRPDNRAQRPDSPWTCPEFTGTAQNGTQLLGGGDTAG